MTDTPDIQAIRAEALDMYIADLRQKLPMDDSLDALLAALETERQANRVLVQNVNDMQAALIAARAIAARQADAERDAARAETKALRAALGAAQKEIETLRQPIDYRDIAALRDQVAALQTRNQALRDALIVVRDEHEKSVLRWTTERDAARAEIDTRRNQVRGQPITRGEALRRSRQVMESAERKRLEAAQADGAGRVTP